MHTTGYISTEHSLPLNYLKPDQPTPLILKQQPNKPWTDLTTWFHQVNCLTNCPIFKEMSLYPIFGYTQTNNKYNFIYSFLTHLQFYILETIPLFYSFIQKVLSRAYILWFSARAGDTMVCKNLRDICPLGCLGQRKSHHLLNDHEQKCNSDKDYKWMLLVVCLTITTNPEGRIFHSSLYFIYKLNFNTIHKQTEYLMLHLRYVLT